MANVVQIKRSDSTGVQPAAGELAHGELAVNLADGILFSKDGSGNIKKIGGDAYDLNTTAATSGTGGKITLNRTSSGAPVTDGVVEIIGSDTVTVTRSGTGTAGVLTLSSGGGTLTDLTADAYDDGTKVEPNSGTIAILGGTGIGTVGSDSNDRIVINIDSTVTTLTGTQTLTNKTLTLPQINDTTADHQYVFAVSELTADRTVTLPLLTGNDEFVFKAHTQTFTNKTFDLDSNTLTGTLAEFNTAMQGDSFVSLTGNETLTNKTLTSPTINSGNVGTALNLLEDAVIVFEGATDNGFETTVTVADPTADRTITLPDATDTLVGKATTDTLTNKSIDLDSNTLTGTLSEFNTALQGDGFVSLTGAETLTNKTLTSPTASGLTLSDASIVFEGATTNDFETTLTVTDPTADRTITIPNVTGTVVTTGDSGTVTNTMLAGSIVNSKLVNSSITLNGDNNSTTLELGSTLKIGSNDAALTSAASTTGGGVDQVMFSVNVDDSSIEIDSSNGLQVKALGVTNAMLAGSIADTKLNKITTANKVGGESIDITSATDGHSTPITIADDDFMLLDDAGTTKHIKMSQIKTYLAVGEGTFAISNLDVDGGTDKAAPVVGDELIIADSQASGATKKADVGSILDIISGDVAVDGSGVATIQPNSVALGTDTTGNFVATLADAGNDFTISNSGAENAGVTIGLGNADGDISVTRDASIGRNLTATAATAITLGAGTSTVTIGDDLDVTGNLEVTGDLTVNGTTTTVNTTNLIVEDPIIHLAKGNNSGDTVDIGFFGEYRSSETGNPQVHAGLVRDASATTWNGTTQKGGFILFSESTDVPNTSFNHTNATAFQYGALAVGHLAFGTTGGAITAATTPHIEASGGIDLSSSGSNAQKYTDGINAPGELHFMTTRNCIIDCGSFDGS